MLFRSEGSKLIDFARADDFRRGRMVSTIARACYVASVVCMTASHTAHAQDYPTKAIRFVVPSTPGGGADVLARSIGPHLAHGLGKPVVIENRAGAGGIIGYEIVAQSPPDG